MKQYMLVIGSIFFGILAAYLYWSQIEKERNILNNALRPVDVIQVIGTLEARDIITRENVRPTTIKIPPNSPEAQRYLPASAINRVIGKEVTNHIAQETILQTNDIDWGFDPNANFSRIISPNGGFRAVSVAVSSVSSVSNLIRPMDRVDIIGTFSSPDNKGDFTRDMVTYTILQNVTVLATGSTYDPNSQSNARGYNSLTLQVTPLEAELLVFASSRGGGGGSLTFTLRSPSDTNTNNVLKTINFKYMEDNIAEFAKNRNAKKY